MLLGDTRSSKQQFRQKKTKERVIPIPFNGLNTRDQLIITEGNYASKLENFNFEEGKLKIRKGYIAHVTGITGDVETLMPYKSATTSKLFAAANNEIYDVTSSGTLGAAVVSSLTNNRWDFTQFTSAGSDYLMLVNGADGVRSYDGTSWATESITGATAGQVAKFKGVIHHKARLWYIEDGTFNLWYMDSVLAKSGGATVFNVGAICALGGKVVAIASWTRDGGSGLDDHFVVITSEGEVLIYLGIDPATTGWYLVGRFVIPKPVGNSRCVINVGTDLIILTEIGLVSMTAVTSGRAVLGEFSDLISPTFIEYVRDAGTQFGWEVKQFFKDNLLIVNVPTVQTKNNMLVFSMKNKAWSQWTQIDALCLVEFNGDIYFGGNTKVYKFSGTSDNGDPILCDVIFGWTDFNIPNWKTFQAARLYFKGSNDPKPRVYMHVDYDIRDNLLNTPDLTYGITETSGGVWDVATWDEAEWSLAILGATSRVDLNSEGIVAAFRIQLRTNDAELEIAGVHISFEVGAVM